MKNLTVNMPLAVPHQRPPSKYASHPYPVLVDEDAYISSVKPLSITQKTMLHRLYADDSYISTVKPLAVAVRNTLIKKDIEDAYISTVKPLSVAVRDLLITRQIDDADAYISTVKPLSVSSKTLLIEYEHPDNDAYKSTVKPLSISLIETALRGYAQDAYISSVRALSVSVENVEQQSLIPTDTILHYPFNGDVLDSSINELHGIKTGNTNFVAGRKAETQALEFVAGCVKTPIALPVNSEKMTISLWLKTISTDVGVVYEISQDNNVNERAPALFINNSGVSKIDSAYKAATVGTEPQYNIPSSPVSLGGDWQHILIDIDTSRVGNQEQRIYVNNVLTSTYATEFSYNSAGNIGSYVLNIGQRNASQFSLKAKMQDVRFYNRLMSRDEHTALYNE